MKYIFDFDEVLFNTTALKEKMVAAGILESERGLAVFEKLEAFDPTFSCAALVFPGARAFLEAHGADCIIVSSASSITAGNNTDLALQRAFQLEKVARSGVERLVSAVYIVDTTKKETLQLIKTALEHEGEDMVFVDDRTMYIEEALGLGIKSILMDRTCRTDPECVGTYAGSLEFPCVGSFAEFDEVVTSWKEAVV